MADNDAHPPEQDRPEDGPAKGGPSNGGDGGEAGIPAVTSSGMEHGLTLTLGVLATVVASYVGLVAIPNWQTRGLEPLELENGQIYPPPMSASEKQGKALYESLGCIYCHSQQVRQDNFGGDLDRGWGMRSSVPVDYVREETPLLGTMRTGPDLRNIGARQPSRQWHYLHLYNPQITSPGSIMPPFRFLFDTVPSEGATHVPPGWIELPGAYAIPGKKVVATDRARALVDYLLSLDYQQKLPDRAHVGSVKPREAAP